MEILISGANGFIGRHFLEVCISKIENPKITVIGKTKPQDFGEIIDFIEVDFLNKEDIQNIFNEKRYDIFYHFAWVSNPGGNLNSSLNYEFFSNTIYAINLFYSTGGITFVGIGSCFEYDNFYSYCNEETPLKPENLYEFYKIQVYKYLKSYADFYNKNYIWARIFNVYGNGEHDQRLFPYIVEGIINTKKIYCKQSIVVRDYMYVVDTVTAIYELGSNKAGGVFNICSGKGIKLSTFCNEINKQFNFKGDIKYLNENITIFKQVGNNDKLSEYFEPKYTLETGISDAIKRRLNVDNR